MRRPRLTVRRMMILVLVAALGLGLVVPALRLGFVASTGYHAHPDGSYHRAEFFARYWRKVLGQPWPGSYVCTQGNGGPFVDVDFPAPRQWLKTAAYLLAFSAFAAGMVAAVIRLARIAARPFLATRRGV